MLCVRIASCEVVPMSTHHLCFNLKAKIKNKYAFMYENVLCNMKMYYVIGVEHLLYAGSKGLIQT